MLTAFTAGLTLITISELGDKTFFIAMILATRHSKRWVFLGSWAALIVMTLLSVAVGKVFQLLPREFTFYAAILLFTIFGLKMLIQSWQMEDTPCEDECEAAVETVEKAEANLSRWGSNPAWATFLEAFSLTFIAEWGDRTQIATITLAATNHALGVALGAMMGHGSCVAIAVLGGGLMAGRISERILTLSGGALFLIFAIVTALGGV
ncbi:MULTISPECIES: TMEM165/GDT1 family protein [unclassified Thermosynechococcus]|uniref:TMEM165/GDT1 family protein n=1 Tax=unclassified Thermosynechococcus TaxID=2622553 RepID=UPI001A0EFE96|nr:MULTISPECIES: TMEM165/GDT1 family protein [unclassified Thermosynechococcus]HIK35707.1 TMEM165/GDT1 family protein [Thermosynechococcus sp. M98_K2018_005]HIK47480.1 TMEM165/GDT1 family protein [Thermosynechococcus sp. M55_K2018_012]